METEELVTTPEVTETNVDDSFYDDIADSIDLTDISKEESDELETSNNDDEETESQPEQAEETESTHDNKEQELLDLLKGRVKYNHEEVTIDSIDDLVTNYQKGLNYDNKVKSFEESPLNQWITQKATELGMTPDQYVEQAIEFEKKEQERLAQQEVEQMIENGVPEEVAKEVMATKNLRKQLELEKSELKAQQETEAQKEKEKRELEDFIKEYPEVKADDIPKEVFLNAQNDKVQLKYAYAHYLSKQLKSQNQVLENNNKNYQSSVGSVSGENSIENKKKDSFLEGFDTDY